MYDKHSLVLHLYLSYKPACLCSYLIKPNLLTFLLPEMLCPSLFSFPLADTHLFFCAESHSRNCQEASRVDNLKTRMFTNSISAG